MNKFHLADDVLAHGDLHKNYKREIAEVDNDRLRN